MNRREYLKQLEETEDVTFVIVKVVKDENTPFYHEEYYQTPIRLVKTWLEATNNEEYIVVKKDTCPIDITGIWDGWYKRGRLKCCMIMKKSDLFVRYSESQAKDMIAYYERIIK